MKCIHPPRTSPALSRRATTLMEVLMSILIMSIGVVMVATLFPIAALKTVQATHLTNAAILRYNAEAILDTAPELIHNPDGDNDVIEHFRRPANRRYIVDPLGFNLMPSGLRSRFGNDGTNPFGLLRYPGFLDANGDFQFAAADGDVDFGLGTLNDNSRANAVARTTLPDSWVTHVDGFAKASTLQQTGTPPAYIYTIELQGNPDLSTVSTAATAPSQVLLFHVGGRRAQVFPVFSVDDAANTVTWKSSTPIPSEYTGTTIGRVLVQTKEQRYTFLYTVRKQGDGQANIDVVVFFRRGFSQLDEVRYAVTDDHGPNFGTQAASRDVNLGLADEDLATDVNINYASPAPRPTIRQGSYIMDADNGRWYRIQSVIRENASQARLRLNRPLIQDMSAAIIMSAVVEVYPIGKKSFDIP